MEKTKQELIDGIIEKIGKLPPNGQKAVIFIIDNLDLIKKMCENSDMDSEELDRQIETAKTAKDYTLLALLSAAQIFSANKH